MADAGIKKVIIKKASLPPPQKRGWLSNLLGWASPDNQDDSKR